MTSRPNVVIIDDDVVMLKILTTILTTRGFQVRAASDADTGLHLAENQNPNLIILDINLPRVNGLQLLQKFRNNSLTHDIPVLMLTGEEKSRCARQSFDLGANAYFTKPFNHRELLEKISQLVSKES